jgi:glycosyltransferase involved in cell wall biosynthesis
MKVDSYPTVTAVIPCFNASKTIERCLRSVASQSIPFDQILVCDDGSTDGTADVVKSAAISLGIKITLLRQEHAGVANARNHAVSHAHCDFVSFVDADDEYHADTLASLKSIHSKNTDAVVCFGDALRRENGRIGNQSYLRPKLVEEGVDFIRDGSSLKLVDPFAQLLPGAFIAPGTFMIRRDAFPAAGPCDPKLPSAVDRDMFLNVALHCSGPWAFTWAKLATIHYQSNSLSSRDNAIRHSMNALNVLEKYRNFLPEKGAHLEILLGAEKESIEKALYWASAKGPSFVHRTFLAIPSRHKDAEAYFLYGRRLIESLLRAPLNRPLSERTNFLDTLRRTPVGRQAAGAQECEVASDR